MSDILKGPIKLENICEVIMGQSPPGQTVSNTPKGLPFLQGCAEFGSLYPLSQKWCSSPLKVCNRDDILISVRAPVGELNIADQEYCIGRGLAAVRFGENFPTSYGWHVLRFWSNNLRSRAQGSTFEAVSRRDIENLIVNISPYNERAVIAVILDTVDKAIRRTEALIEKLRRIKAGLLHDLLTRGLDENGQLRDPLLHPEQFRDSQLEMIPKNKDLIPFSDLVFVNPSLSLKLPSPESEVSFIPMQDASDTGEWINRQTRKLSSIGSSFTSFQEGDVLFAKITPCMENGKGAHALGLVKGVGFGSTEFHVLRPRQGNSPRYIYHWCHTRELRLAAEVNMTGTAGQQRVPAEFFTRFTIPKMDPDEQSKIAVILDSMGEAVQREEKQKEKLHLLKAGLMQDLLTGRVRVTKSLIEQFQAPDEGA
jgi:type I restriction enzyme S subunit